MLNAYSARRCKCGNPITDKRKGALYCSPRYGQAAYRPEKRHSNSIIYMPLDLLESRDGQPVTDSWLAIRERQRTNGPKREDQEEGTRTTLTGPSLVRREQSENHGGYAAFYVVDCATVHVRQRQRT